MLDAAARLFVDKGYAGTSLAAVVRLSGGSLATLYELFDNKQGLLRAVMEREKERSFAGFVESFEAEPSAQTALRMLAERVHAFLLSERVVAMTRIVVQESLRDPQFGQDFYCERQTERLTMMAAIFARWTAAGRARIDQPEQASALFFATVVGDAQVNALVGLGPCATVARETLAWRVAHFCRSFSIV